MQRVLLFISLCLSCAMFAEVKDNETLIYDWDVHHKIYYYCQFGTRDQIEKNFQSQCFRRNKQMQHILPDGTVTFPYISYGSSFGFVLKCHDVPQADLHSCSKLLYTTCSYTCKGSNVTREMTCEQKGPLVNVTAQWSIAQPCTDNPGPGVQPVTQLTVLGSSYGKVSAHPMTTSVKTTSVAFSMAAANNNSSAEFTTSPVVIVETPTVEALAKVPTTTLIVSSVTVVAVLTFIAIVLTVLYKCFLKRRQRKSRDISERCQFPDEKNSFKDVTITFSRTNAESKQPLVNVEEDDNLQKSSFKEEEESDTETTISVADIDDSKIASVLMEMEPLNSGFDSWDKTKQLLDINMAAAPAQPEQCCASVSLLQEQTGAYRRNLRAQLEVISCRTREQALIGYMEQHMHYFKYQSLNELKMLEQTYERQVEEKVSDVFLRVLAAYGVKIGYIMEYFYQHKNWDAIGAILQVHKACPYCEQFRRLRDNLLCG